VLSNSWVQFLRTALFAFLPCRKTHSSVFALRGTQFEFGTRVVALWHSEFVFALG
jgi:hypothetical protein